MKEWIYGRNPVYESLRAGRRDAFRLWIAEGAEHKGRLAEIIDLCRGKNLPVETLPRQKLEKISHHHQGVALEVGAYPYRSLEEMLELAQAREEPPFLLVLDALQDPQNLGTLLRTAEIVGVHGVLLPLRQTATITPAVVNASSGASEHLLVAQANLAQAIETLKQNDVWVVGLDGGPESQTPDQLNLKGAIALVVGNEGQGMRRLVRETCDLLMRLPMRGQIESLNAAAAGSVALYLAWGARGYAGNSDD
jgi:23S rRNA (guanosine2251-2'-O)-methyltransferase